MHTITCKKYFGEFVLKNLCCSPQEDIQGSKHLKIQKLIQGGLGWTVETCRSYKDKGQTLDHSIYQYLCQLALAFGILFILLFTKIKFFSCHTMTEYWNKSVTFTCRSICDFEATGKVANNIWLTVSRAVGPHRHQLCQYSAWSQTSNLCTILLIIWGENRVKWFENFGNGRTWSFSLRSESE